MSATASLTDLMQELESLGAEQTRATYRRHGITGELYGVSYADFGKLVKRIKRDHSLAIALWDTGVHDARILATMIADPASMDKALVERWAASVPDYPTSGALPPLLGKSPHALEIAQSWSESSEELKASMGWSVLTQLAMNDKTLPDDLFERALQTIEQTIHHQPNWVRYSMNNTLIAIGARNESLKEKAIAAAQRIGKVEVDHGDTSCKTPDAVPYILKAYERAAKKR